MQEIVIDGVNLTEVKARFDALNAEMAATRNSVRQGAAKYIANNIKEAKILMDEMLLEETEQLRVDELAQHAHDLLSAANFVSDVSGVSYDLPYYDRQSEYYPQGTSYTAQFDDADNEHVTYDGVVGRLWRLLEDMESEVQEWNTSYC